MVAYYNMPTDRRPQVWISLSIPSDSRTNRQWRSFAWEVPVNSILYLRLPICFGWWLWLPAIYSDHPMYTTWITRNSSRWRPLSFWLRPIMLEALESGKAFNLKAWFLSGRVGDDLLTIICVPEPFNNFKPSCLLTWFIHSSEQIHVSRSVSNRARCCCWVLGATLGLTDIDWILNLPFPQEFVESVKLVIHMGFPLPLLCLYSQRLPASSRCPACGGRFYLRPFGHIIRRINQTGCCNI